ncbi:unnamed protein product [Arabis nemorensis]|uniref:Uncharacterized protein n=1 Tax=Arabis nemorensis TaxID=586526 RepID=A0A565ANJ2_9BRAS|nr:unnamed protein product [Arabis nemorensis]
MEENKISSSEDESSKPESVLDAAEKDHDHVSDSESGSEEESDHEAWKMSVPLRKSLGKGKNGEEPAFSKPHDRKAFGLSKFIWGANGIAPKSVPKSNGLSKKISNKSEKVEFVKQEVVSSLPNSKSCEDEEVANKEEVSSLGMPELDTTFMKSFLAKSLARFGVDAQQGWTRLASEDK